MNVGFFSRHEELNVNNGLFNPLMYQIGQGLEQPLCALKRILEINGYDVHTVENNEFFKFEIVIFIDFPKDINLVIEAKNKCSKLILIAFESDVILPENFTFKTRSYFDLIFTWSPIKVTGNEVLIYWPNTRPPLSIDNKNIEKDSVVLISGNKINLDKRELYSERIRFLACLDKNNFEYDVYGFGWDLDVYKQSVLSVIKKLKLLRLVNALCSRSLFLRFIFKFKIKNNQGKAKDKLEILSKYKFNLCFENAKDIEGYITEKIFDSFYAGSIPIYLGMKDINHYIPSNTFINVRDYKSYDNLIIELKKLNDIDISEYHNNINKFLNSKQYHKFTSENFSSTVYCNINSLINKESV